MVTKDVSCRGNFKFISSEANPPPEAAAAAAIEGFVPDTNWYGDKLSGGGGGRLASGVGCGLKIWRCAVIDTWLRIFFSWPRALEGGAIDCLRSCSGGFSSFSLTWGWMLFLCVKGSHSIVCKEDHLGVWDLNFINYTEKQLEKGSKLHSKAVGLKSHPRILSTCIHVTYYMILHECLKSIPN